MLVISDAQFEMFERMQFDRMLALIQRAIASSFPETCAAPAADDPPPAVRTPNDYATSLIERGIEHAVGLGITDGPDLAAYIALGLALRASGIAPPPWMTGWLDRPETPAATRLAIVEAQLADRAERDAALAAVAARVQSARKLATP